MTSREVLNVYGENTNSNPNSIRLIPQLISIEQHYILLIEKYEYLNKFWISIKLGVVITFLHTIIATITGYVFAKIEFKFRESLFFIFIIVMMMPFQVNLLPNYILAKKIGILYTDYAIILPAIFAPFGFFFMRQTIKYISDEYIEVVLLESNKVIDILLVTIIPYSKPGIISLIVLTFADTWNMVEQPLVLLKDKVSALNKAKEEGERNKALEIAKNLLDVLDDKTISLKTKLTIEEIKKLRMK